MFTESQSTPKSLYDTDYNLWVLETIKQLENKQFKAIDWENLLEELSDLSRREKRKLKNLLRRLLEHLLKLNYWQAEIENNRGHWEAEIASFRKQITDQLEDSPSLKPYLEEIFAECYQDGRELAAARSRLPLETFPEQPIATLEQVLDKHWLP
ncbi:protein of unknown function DUF29 [Halothece sp. PCC 7418]|uniref:DUF29 domain-containing protein n=1 Tax=Halothece sp. (strain PCC 7418) TaxID=65093 RepID=UPI0002A06D5C|nr:DUF29 domain-containing protein [Halothece sp. PCC 7418]AFZ43732.1 protein of unknown function DUF29 [Halothece sp. PCC 7418]